MRRACARTARELRLRASAKDPASACSRELMVTRIAGSAWRRKGAPGITAQPSPWRACTALVSSGTGIQTFRPLGGLDLDAAVGKGCDEGLAAFGVGLGRALQQAADLLVGQQLRRGALEQVAYPAGADHLAAADPVDRVGVAGQDGEAEVWAEGLGEGAGGCPVAAAGGQGDAGRARDRAEVVVLEHHDVGVAVEDGAQRRRPLLVQRGAGGVLAARVEDDRGDAFLQRPGERRRRSSPARRSRPVAGRSRWRAAGGAGRRSPGLRPRSRRRGAAAPRAPARSRRARR